MDPVVKSLIIIALAVGVIYFYYNIYDGTNNHFSKLNNKVYKVRSSHNKELT
jgi:cell division protein FtsL